MKYVVRVVNNTTGEIQMRSVEADSDAEALGKFDASTVTASIVVSSVHSERDQARVERMRRETPPPSSRGARLVVSLISMIAAAIVGISLSIYFRSNAKLKTDDGRPSEQRNDEKAASSDVLNGH